MKIKSRIMKFITAALVGGMLFGTAGIALADSTDTSSTSADKAPLTQGDRVPGGGQQALMKSVIADLVTAGTLTQDQADQLSALTPAKSDETTSTTTTKPKDLLTEAVDQGIITSDEADVIRTAMQDAAEAQRTEALTSKLSTLVDDGTITSDESAAIIAKLQEIEAARQAEMEKLKDMTEEERQAYFKENQTEKTSILADLVSDGTLTQEQADAVAKILPGNSNSGQGSQGVPGKQEGTATQGGQGAPNGTTNMSGGPGGHGGHGGGPVGGPR